MWMQQSPQHRDKHKREKQVSDEESWAAQKKAKPHAVWAPQPPPPHVGPQQHKKKGGENDEEKA